MTFRSRKSAAVMIDVSLDSHKYNIQYHLSHELYVLIDNILS